MVQPNIPSTNSPASMMQPPALGETLAVLLARDMADGEKVIIGTNSDIQLAACNLARQMQAPRLWWISGPGGMVNPQRDRWTAARHFETDATRL